MQTKKAFTLIELLVVIAIIGILSGLIIVSMSGAQNAAKDARVKSAMDQFRSSAEILNLTTGSYNSGTAVALTACTVASGSILPTTTAETTALCNDIVSSQSGGASELMIAATTNAWCIQKKLPTGGTWCLDSKGSVGVYTDCAAGDYTCVSD
ncbi:type II secretion system GspH family protein [bacterium]|jgi:prepilin-type N-terminal cleavage/methylation domain-containing protein|nr:type II secretion system GspH family protein [bacterium]